MRGDHMAEETDGNLSLLYARLYGVLALAAVEAGRVRGQLRAERPSEQLVDGLAQIASHGIPEGYVYPAYGVDGGASPERAGAIVHLLPEHLGVEGITADQHRLEAVLDEGGGYLWWLQPVAQRFPQPVSVCSTSPSFPTDRNRGSAASPLIASQR